MATISSPNVAPRLRQRDTQLECLKKTAIIPRRASIYVSKVTCLPQAHTAHFADFSRLRSGGTSRNRRKAGRRLHCFSIVVLRKPFPPLFEGPQLAQRKLPILWILWYT